AACAFRRCAGPSRQAFSCTASCAQAGLFVPSIECVCTTGFEFAQDREPPYRGNTVELLFLSRLAGVAQRSKHRCGTRRASAIYRLSENSGLLSAGEDLELSFREQRN